jgi:ABC-type antimicrobial peptide transport system permease subunit
LIFRQGFVIVAAGLAAGFLLAVGLMRALRGTMAGFESRNSADFWIAACLAGLAAAAACWIPAGRATKIDPMCALRQD